MEQKLGTNLAPFNPSMPDVVESAIELLGLSSTDVLYELGCGDGRVMIAAAQATPGLRCVGVEYDRVFYLRAQAAIEAGGVGEAVSVRHGDALEVPLDDATAVFVYLVPKGLKLVAPALKEVLRRSGARVVSYLFSVPGLKPASFKEYKSTKVYLYDRTSLSEENVDETDKGVASVLPQSQPVAAASSGEGGGFQR